MLALPRSARNGIRPDRAPPGLEIGNTLPQIVFSNPRYSIKPGSATDQKVSTKITILTCTI